MVDGHLHRIVSLAYQAQKSIEFVWLNSKIELKTEITLDDLARARSSSLSLSLTPVLSLSLYLCYYLCCGASASTSASQVSMAYIAMQTYLYLISLRSCEWGKTKLCFLFFFSLSLYFLSSSVLWSVILSLLLVFMTLRNAFQATGDETRELWTKVLKNLSISRCLPPLLFLSLSRSVSTSFSGGLVILLEIPTRTHFIRTDVSITFYGYLCRERDSRQRTRKPKTTTTTTTTTKATRGQTEETL